MTYAMKLALNRLKDELREVLHVARANSVDQLVLQQAQSRPGMMPKPEYWTGNHPDLESARASGRRHCS